MSGSWLRNYDELIWWGFRIVWLPQFDRTGIKDWLQNEHALRMRKVLDTSQGFPNQNPLNNYGWCLSRGNLLINYNDFFVSLFTEMKNSILVVMNLT